MLVGGVSRRASLRHIQAISRRFVSLLDEVTAIACLVSIRTHAVVRRVILIKVVWGARRHLVVIVGTVATVGRRAQLAEEGVGLAGAVRR